MGTYKCLMKSAAQLIGLQDFRPQDCRELSLEFLQRVNVPKLRINLSRRTLLERIANAESLGRSFFDCRFNGQLTWLEF